MGNYQVLKNLVRYVESQYKTEKYALIIWGHGTGWRNSVIAEKSLAGESSVRAVAIDDKTGSYISVSELGKALENSSLSVIDGIPSFLLILHILIGSYSSIPAVAGSFIIKTPPGFKESKAFCIK